MTRNHTSMTFPRAAGRMRAYWAVVVVVAIAVACSASTTIADPTSEGAGPDAEVQATGEETADDPQATTDGAPVATSAPVDPATLAPGETVVVLLDPGSEPRTELRLDIAATCGETLTLTQVQEVDQTVSGQTSPSNGPVGTVMQIATSATPNGDDYDVQSEIISAMASPGTPVQVAGALNDQLAGVIGITTVTSITNRGEQIPGSTRVEGTEALGPLADTMQSLSQVQAPLPAEPVGIGARWQTASRLQVQGVDLLTVSTTELVAITGTVVELEITGTQNVEPGSVMEAGATPALITEWVGTTTGMTVIDLATISPIRSSSVTELTQGMRFDQGQNYTELQQTIFSEVTASSEPNDGCTGRRAAS